MRGVVISVKALVLIFLTISISFMTSDLSFVSAEGSGNVCCEETVAGDTCVYTSEENCAEDSIQASTTCELTAFCKAGCCISDLGQCSKGVAQATCDSIEGYTWSEGSDCAVESCQKNCCVIAESQCAYTTEAHCEILIEDLEDITLDWREVDSEATCTDICKASIKGCCVTSDSCVYGTRSECEDPSIDITEGTGFYQETYCSDIGSCGCSAGESYACIDEDVYSFDACGNEEGIEEDCDYTAGEWCGTDANGEAGCVSTDCDDTSGDGYATFNGVYYVNTEEPGSVGEANPRNTHDTAIGGERQNGESWCLYESPAGGFKDFPGSQHYRAYCYFGEEIIEPCADFREQVCIQIPYTDYVGVNEQGLWSLEENSYSYSGEYTGPTGSACIDNTDNAIFNPNTTTVSVGALWDDDSLIEKCALGNVDCQQAYAKDSWTDASFQVGQGVMCSSPQWTKALHEYCRSQGDCGNAMNLVEDFTDKGFYMSSTQNFFTATDKDNNNYHVFVGYDYCVDRFVESIDGSEYGDVLGLGAEGSFDDQIKEIQNYEQEAVYCLYECKEVVADADGNGALDIGEDGNAEHCQFIRTVDENFYEKYYSNDNADYYQQLMVAREDDTLILEQDFPDITFDSDLGKDSYGVYGGLSALSQMYESADLGEISATLTWVIILGSVSVAGSLVIAGATGAVGEVGKALAGQASKVAGDVGAQVAAKAGEQAAEKAGAFAFRDSIAIATEKAVAAKAAENTAKTAAKEAADVSAKASAELAAKEAATNAAVIAGIITIVTTIIDWIEVASTENPIERSQQMGAFAIASTIAAGITAISLYVAATGAGLGPAGWAVSIAALLVTAFAAVMSYGGEVRDNTISSHCEAWQPPEGGDYCELCDTAVSEGGLAMDDGEGHILRGWECTEYKCTSLGMACAYISENQGTDRPKCIGVEIDDVNRPIIQKYFLDVSDDMNDEGVDDTDEYTDEDSSSYSFVSNDGTSETGSGYLSIETNVWPYQYFTFGIETDEASQCKISQTLPESYDAMDQYFPDSYFDYQHNQSWILVPNTKYNFYIVCQDHNGNGAAPPVPFVVQVETDAGADITPPSIEATSLRNGAYVPSGVEDTALSIYLDGVVDGCRWSRIDQEYSLMEGAFICPGVPESASAYFDDDCSTVLNITEEINYYYFACTDQDGNSNTENYAFTLQATDPLNIDYVSPAGTLYTDTTTLTVQTSAGAENGKAVCYYDSVAFFETNSSLSKQSLEDLAAGAYDFDILCQDVAGNQNTSLISFTIDVDVTVPELLSIYRQESSVYFTLDEIASCEYYFEDFTFGLGTALSTSSLSGSFTLADTTKYYLKCQDVFSNEASWIVQV